MNKKQWLKSKQKSKDKFFAKIQKRKTIKKA